ncbi:MAG: hypothetical protein ACYCX3_10660, partial [Thermoleophilia bacterium]
MDQTAPERRCCSGVYPTRQSRCRHHAPSRHPLLSYQCRCRRRIEHQVNALQADLRREHGQHGEGSRRHLHTNQVGVT